MNLDKFQAYSLRREINGASFYPNEAENCFVGEVPISEDTFDDISNFYVRQQVDIEHCDVLVSINSQANNGIVSAPPLVNHMLKYVDCKVSFSYAITSK